jgi:hypothetical protein
MNLKIQNLIIFAIKEGIDINTPFHILHNKIEF